MVKENLNLNVEEEDVYLELTDGALCGLSDGAKMNVVSSIVEYVDNAEDENASKVSIIIENNTLSVLSVEETNLERKDFRKLFSLGVGGKLHTKKTGVGKYSQGFKYAGPHLIGGGNSGKIRVCVKPISGNNWSATQYINYIDENNYTDKRITLSNDVSDIPEGYNFMVKVVGCKNISDIDIIKLQIGLGIRYREKIANGKTCIDINGVDILPQDRLYSQHGVRVDYHEPVYFSWGGNENAISFEWSDLKKTDFNDTELIDYDTTLGIKGRQKGTSITCRSGIEVAINGVTIIPDRELANIIGVTEQPKSCGFRGRMNILNVDLADCHVRGGNKSCSSINKSFLEDEDTLKIRKHISDVYNSVINRYKSDANTDKQYYSIPALDKYCKDYNIDCDFKFSNTNKDIEAFVYEKTYNRIVINVNSPIMSSFISDTAKLLFIVSLIDNCKVQTTEDIYKRMKKFKNSCEIDEII